MRAGAPLALTVLALALGACGGSGDGPPEPTDDGGDPAVSQPRPDGPRPNVIAIVTDDQTLESFNEDVMPKTVRELADRGTSFSQAIVSTPQCCPSRAGYLTGQYSQNNGVTSNNPGYPLLEDKPSVLPSWLQAAGYETVHVGKYLNGYFNAEGLTPGPGWDRWLTLTNNDYLRAEWSIDGSAETFPGEHLTDTTNRLAVEELRRLASDSRPFYLQVDHLAPHDGSGRERDRCRGGPIPAPGDGDAFADARAPRNPATEEADVSDKPTYVTRNPAPGPAETAEADRLYRCALASLQAVDRGIGRLVSELRRAGELDETVIIFTSDNGFAFLEHRVPTTKGMPYEEHLRVPLVIRLPRGMVEGARAGAALDAPVANIDLAPTLLALIGAPACTEDGECRRMDGRSLLSLLGGGKPNWTADRAIRTGFAIGAPTYGLSCSWDGLRTPELALVRHTLLPLSLRNECEAAEELEFYDLDADPFQLEGDGPIPDGLEQRLDRLIDCSGVEGRDEELDDRPFCE